MTRIARVLTELARNLRRYPGTALGSLLSLLLLFLLFDLFWIASVTSDRFYRDLLSEIRMEVFLDEGVADSSITGLSRSIMSLEEVSAADYVSKESARDELARLVGIDLLVGYDSANPLPRSFVLTIEPMYLNTQDMATLETELARLTGSGEIQYSRHWLEKAETTRSLILRIGLALGALIILTTLISSANNIRLMARTKAVGFRQMLLLGAGRLFIAFPFVLEGFLLAGLSAAAGWALIFYGRGKVVFTQFELVFPAGDEVVIYCLIIALLGSLSGYLGVRKLLK
ncbi:MAG TPA: permease-like cell division protein FtsX [Acidobacteriota bacterium]|nr:permease-like cell division protein FtsX [Acidobacteriota bacterium]